MSKKGLSINKNELLVCFFEITILFLCTAFSKYPVFSYISLLVFMFSLIKILEKRAIIFVKYLAIIFMIGSLLVGCFCIEFTDLYLSEIQSNSKFVGCIPLLMLSFWVLIQTIYYIEKRSEVSLSNALLHLSSRKSKNAVLIVSFLVLFVFGIHFLSIVAHPSFIVGLERAAYSKAFLDNPVLNTFYNYAILLVIIPVLLIVNYKDWKRCLGVLCVILYILNSIWMGDKFGSLLQLLEIILIVFSGPMISNLSNKKIKKYAVISILCLIGLVGIAVIIKNSNSESILENYFMNRVASQGELWWKIFALFDGTPNLLNFSNEIKSFIFANNIISENVGAKYGIYNIMYLTSNKAWIDSYLSSGYRYSQAGFAAMYYYFGYFGPIIYGVIYGFLSSKLTNRLIKALNKGLVIETFIYIRLLIFMYSAFANFIFNFFFSTLTIITYIYLLSSKNSRITFKSVK